MAKANYFVSDRARLNRPHHLPLSLPEHSDFHAEHAAVMWDTSEEVSPAKSETPAPVEPGWYNEHLAD